MTIETRSRQTLFNTVKEHLNNQYFVIANIGPAQIALIEIPRYSGITWYSARKFTKDKIPDATRMPYPVLLYQKPTSGWKSLNSCLELVHREEKPEKVSQQIQIWRLNWAAPSWAVTPNMKLWTAIVYQWCI